MRSRLRRWAPALVVGVIALGAIVIVSVFLLPDVLRLSAWETVDGVVLEARPAQSGTFVRWEYRAAGEFQTGSTLLSGTTPESLAESGIVEGGPIPLHYDPADPTESIPDTVLERSVAVFLVVVAVSVLAFAVSLVVVVVQSRRRRGRFLEDSRPQDRRPLTTTRSGLLGVKTRQGLSAVMEQGGISMIGSGRVRWDDLVDVAFDPSDNTLRLEREGKEYRHVRMYLPRDQAEDWAGAVVALVWFAMTFPAARASLDRPSTVRKLLREIGQAVKRTQDSQPAAWTASEHSRLALEETMQRLTEEAGPVVVAGRPVRGYDLDPARDPDVLASARAWLPPELDSDPPPDAALADALLAAQGKQPPWPFDILIGRGRTRT